MNKAAPVDIPLKQLLDLQPDALLWLCPVHASKDASVNEVVDFQVQYGNQAAISIFPLVAIAGESRVAYLEQAFGGRLLPSFLQVWASGQSQDATLHSPLLDRYFQVQSTRVEQGILTTFRDRTAAVKAEMEHQEQERKFHSIIDNAQDGIMLLKPLKNAQGEINDYRIDYCNQSGFEVGSLPANAIGRSIYDVFPHMKGNQQLELHKQVAETGVPARFETIFTTPEGQQYGWFLVSLTRAGDTVVSRFTDISQRKQYERQIEEQRDLLDRSFEVSYNAFILQEAIRDEQGSLVDLRYLRVNQRYLNLMGLKENEVLGNTLLQVFPGAQKAGVMTLQEKALETGEPQRAEIHYHHDGLDGWYDLSVVKVTDERVLVTFSDITDQKLALINLHEQKTLLDNLLRHSSNGISITEMIRDAEGKVIDGRSILANDAAVEYTGIPQDLYFSKTAREIDPKIADTPYYQMCINTLETGEPFISQYFLELTGRWLELTVSRMDENRLIHIFTDITGVKKAALKLERLVDDLKRSNASLEEFAYAASHDLQEPLRKIQYFSDRLKENLFGTLSEENRQMLERMLNATFRMRTLIQDLLTYSRVSMKTETFRVVQLSDVVQQVILDFEPLIAETGALIGIADLPEIHGDEGQLRQLFQNLIGNALKYRKPGVPPEIMIRAVLLSPTDKQLPAALGQDNRNYYCVEVADNGIGFLQEDAERIFQVFQRLHGRAEYEGTGIGLAIVQKVVNNHRGYIYAQSEPDAGASFQVYFPA